MVTAIRPLDPAWHAWLAEHPGYEVTNCEERGDRGTRYLPVVFTANGWRGLLVRWPDGHIDPPYWRG